MPPSFACAAAATRSQSALLATSAVTKAAPISAAAACPAASSRPVMRTRAPLQAKTDAMPFPMPRVPPVTTTARPSTDVNMPRTPSW